MLFLILSLTLTLLLLEAVPLEWTKVTLGLSNDVWSNGMSRNDDDQDSFALFTCLDTNLGWLRLDAHSITNRGWREGWEPGHPDVSDTSPLYRGRYDDVELFLGHEFAYQTEDAGTLSLALEAGLLSRGKLGMGLAQNALHQVTTIHGVELPYESEGIEVRPALRAEGSYTYSLLNTSQRQLSLQVGARVEAFFTASYGENLYAGLVLSGKGSDNAYLKVGYNRTQVTSGSPTEELYGRYCNSPELTYGYRAGGFTLDYKTYLKTGFGTTKVTMNLISLFQRETTYTMPEEDAERVYLSYSFGDPVNYVTLGLEVPGSENLSLYFLDQYTAGTPVSTKEEALSDMATEPRKKVNDGFFTVGVKYTPTLEFTNLFEFYGYLTGGVAFLRYDIIQNMIDDPSIQTPAKENLTLRPCLNLGLGIETSLIQLPFLKGVPFSLNSSISFIVTPFANHLPLEEIGFERPLFSSYLNIGVSFPLDI